MSEMVPDGWTMARFGDVTSSIKSGLSRRISPLDIGLPVLNSGNIKNNLLDAKELKYWYLDDPQGANVDSYILDDGDILLNFINSMSQIGKSCIFKSIGRPAIYTTNLFRIKTCSSSDSQYVHQLMLNTDFQSEIQLISKPAVNQASFTKQDLVNINVTLPPLPEQQKIAAILTSVDDVIEKTQAQINKLQDLKKGTMNELLTRGIGHRSFKESPVGMIPVDWDVAELGEVAQLSSGGTPDRANLNYWGGSIPWIKTGEVNYSVIKAAEETITTQGLSNSSAKLIKSGAVLMAMYGQGVTRGKVAVLGVDATVNQACLAIIPRVQVLNTFLYYFLSSQYENLRGLVQEGAQKNLSAGIVKKVNTPVPSLTEQQEIASTLTAIDTKIEAKQAKLQHTQALKKALMQDLLTGKKRVAA